MTKEERDRLIEQIRLHWEERFDRNLGIADRRLAKERMMVAYKEYGERLPRVPVGRCPFTSQVLKHSFDPFDLDGHWWHSIEMFRIDEPIAPPTFKAWLGALNLHGRIPSETQEGIEPGPDVPFVIPRLLSLPDMHAVISSRRIETGDRAYIMTYWCRTDIPEIQLHQGWLRSQQWMSNGNWAIHTDSWDFALRPYLDSGQVSWVMPDDDDMTLHQGVDDCPYLDLPGDRRKQIIKWGKRILGTNPTGVPINPFNE